MAFVKLGRREIVANEPALVKDEERGQAQIERIEQEMDNHNLQEHQLSYEIKLRREIDNEYIPDYEATCRGDPRLLVNLALGTLNFR